MKQLMGFFIVFLISMDGVMAQFSGNTLSQAVDNTAYNFQTEAPRFFRQTNLFTTGGDAAQSANIGNDENSIMLVNVRGPVLVSFDWRVSSEQGFDGLVFIILDSNVDPTGIEAEVSGFVNWNRRTFNVPAGNHTLAWVYVKDGSVSSGLDAGWVDNVVIGTAALPKPNNSVNIAPVISLLLSD